MIDDLYDQNDLTLISQWQMGNEEAFDALYKRHVLELLGMVTKKIGSIEIAKELVQDVFLVLCEKKNELPKIEHLKGYLFGIAKNKIFNYYRQELVKEKYELLKTLQENRMVINKEDDFLEIKELERLINDEISLLSPKCREAFKLSRLEKLSYKSIAMQMGISENTVDLHIRKALKILRHALKNYQGKIVAIDLLILCLTIK